MDSFQVRRAGAFLYSALLADTLRCSCRRAPRGTAPSRRLGARQPGRCDAPRSLTASFYRRKMRHRVLPPACSPLSPCQRHVARRGRCRSVVALQKGPWPRQTRSSHLLLLRERRLGPALPPAAAAPHPCALSSQPRRHKRLSGVGTAGLADTRTKGLFSQQLLVGFYLLSKFFTTTSGFFKVWTVRKMTMVQIFQT